MLFSGVVMLVLGGISAGSFYIPLKKVNGWSWESGWISFGLFAWIIGPLAVAALTAPEFGGMIAASGSRTVFMTWFMGFLWGIGAVTFGLSMRYLGMSLGYALALGSCAAFGTLIPPIVKGQFMGLLSTTSGQLTLSGVLVCLVGVAVCGYAGVRKEREVSTDLKQASTAEFNFPKGIVVALVSGLMNACLAFSFEFGRPIAEEALSAGVAPLWQNNPVLVVALMGGFTTNVIYCLFLNVKNRTGGDYFRARAPLLKNYALAAVAGWLWYVQFMLYGMGSTRLGEYAFASWSVLMAVVVAVSNIWGLWFKEWQGVSRRTIGVIVTGILLVLLSIVLIGAGGYAAQT
ncbi:L-rhamnose/proton symporter RhaT [Kiritimatiella glycovorans]|uniref:L-rhamnose-H(+) transport protein n=1 Tax=Kiritimatiella glycovorans TaxID=1307763 RepID=A0A0G3ED05_9BACT|nr:L-rhamnose/proton symporter RhaT [Kiritimatiella glycovorans]AKJ64193.1 L-rhamnose-H(+) transport protein [Kiritimatiella glycovorans]